MLLFQAVAFTNLEFKAAFLEQAKMYKKVVATDSEGKASTYPEWHFWFSRWLQFRAKRTRSLVHDIEVG